MDPFTIAAFAGLGFFVYQGVEKGTIGNPKLPVSNGQTVSKYVPLNGMTVKPIVSPVPAKMNTGVMPSGGGQPKNPWFVGPFRNGGSATNTRQTAGATQQVMDRVKAELKEKYDKLSAKERKAGADALNKLIKPNPGLTGDEDFAAVARKVGAVVGASAGGAAMAWAGPLGVTLGGIAGAYLGEELGAEFAKKWKDVEKWAGNAAKTVEKKIENAVNNTVGKVGDAIADLF